MRITWLKLFTSFGSCCFNSRTLTQEVPYTAAVPPTLETSMEIQASQNLSQSLSRLWIRKLRECRMKIWLWMRAGGKAAGWEINSSPVITFVQGQQGAQQEPPETSLSFPASFLSFASLASSTISYHTWVKHDKNVQIHQHSHRYFLILHLYPFIPIKSSDSGN